MSTEDRIRAALSAAADSVTDGGLRDGAPPTGGPEVIPSRHRRRWLAPVLVAAAVAVIAAGSAGVLWSRHHTAAPAVTGGPSRTRSTPVSTTPGSPTPSHTTTTGGSSAPSSSGSSTGTVNCFFADFGCPVSSTYVFYQPLWPFASYLQAKQWEDVDGPAGHQPWHASPGQTALSFTRGYLGFTDITMVTSTQTASAEQAYVGVGYRNPAGQLHTAAVLHLVRYTPTPGNTRAGWEVVGSQDHALSLEQPAYGSQVSSPMTVGGHITGVDESIVVTVRTLAGAHTTYPGRAAGGVHTPWSESIPFTETGVLTIVASSGGHLTQHEMFAIQGVHTD